MNLFQNILNKASNVTGIWMSDPTQSSVYKLLAPYEQTAENVTWAMQDTTKMYEQKAQGISQWSSGLANSPWYIKLGQMVKKWHPEYSDMTDGELGQKMLAKYPEYQDIVDSERTALWQWAKILWWIGSSFVSTPWIVTWGSLNIGEGTAKVATAQSMQDVAGGYLQAGKGSLQSGFWVATWVTPIASTVFWGLSWTDTAQQAMGYVWKKSGDIGAWTAQFLGGNEQVQEQARWFGEQAVAPALLYWLSKWWKIASPYISAGAKKAWEAISNAVPKVVQSVKNLSSTIWQKYQWARKYLSGLDEKEISAIETSSAKELDDIIKQAKATQGKQGDYVQTPYHVGAEKAQKTLNQLDTDLKTRQSERLAVLDEAPIATIDATDARMALKSALRSMNVEDIRIVDGKPEIIPVKWREALLDLSNPADVKALQKLNEILDGDVSPTQTMDRIKKLQEWAYENKSTIGVKGTSERMDGLIKRVQGSLNSTFKKQLPPEYKKILDSMSEDIKLSNDIKRVFGIDDAGNPVWNRGEMVMKRLANGTTTGGEARLLAKQIFDRYGIDLVKEARLRQMAMDLVWDARGQTLFGAITRGKSGIVDLVMQKTLGKIVNKEWVVRSLAKWKGEVIKKTEPIYTPNTFRKAMSEEAKKPKALPAPSWKATWAKNVRVNQPMEKSPIKNEGQTWARPTTPKKK